MQSAEMFWHGLTECTERAAGLIAPFVGECQTGPAGPPASAEGVAIAAPPACPLVATGTWRATDVVSWTPGTSHGVYRGGTLVMHATFTPNGKPQIKNVLIQVDCNLGPAGFSTGKPEGVVVRFPGPPQVVFAPTSPTTGVTVFTLGEGQAG